MNPRGLVAYVLGRLAFTLVLLLLLSVGIFALIHAAPGTPEQAILGTRPSTPALVSAIEKRYGLDGPLPSQYVRWLGNALRLDFGESTRSGREVTTEIKDALGVTLLLVTIAFPLAMLMGVGLGTFTATRHGRAADRLVVGVSVVALSAPPFVTGLALLYLFSGVVPIFPVFGSGSSGVLDRLYHLVLPGVALALSLFAISLRLTRTGMVESLDQDYVAFARARGVPGRVVMCSYALRNALIPIVSGGGVILILMFAGAVLVEEMFSLPGIGSLLVTSVNSQDVPLVQGIALTLAAVILLVNLCVDLLYVLIDPRAQFGAASR